MTTPDQPPLVFALSKRLLFFRFAGTLHHISTVRWGPVPSYEILGRPFYKTRASQLPTGVISHTLTHATTPGRQAARRLIRSTDPTAHTASICRNFSRLIMASKMCRPVVVVVATVTSIAGVALATDEPAPSPTSGAIAASSSLVAAILCPAAALLFGNLRH
ncbi:hypothetical protein ABZP36_016980 [Zizania latifolia]